MESSVGCNDIVEFREPFVMLRPSADIRSLAQQKDTEERVQERAWPAPERVLLRCTA